MANIKSNIKRKKQADKSYLKNKALKSQIKTYMKKAKKDKKIDDFNYVIKLIDQATSKNVFHKNKSARLKSKIQKLQYQVSQQI